MRVILTAACLAMVSAAQEPGLPQFSTTTRLVVLNVTVRDRSGKAVENLHQDDFLVLEDGKPQTISVFEFQRLGIPEANAPQAGKPSFAPRKGGGRSTHAGPVQYKDRRLIVLYFDLSSMPPEDVARAQRGALKFVENSMAAVDLVAVMSYGARLRMEQDFTADAELLRKAIRGLRAGEASEWAAELETGDPELAADSGAAFQADDAEFQFFNTDRRLAALENAVRMLAALPEKKALVYFSSGAGTAVMGNLSQLRATVNAAVRANVSFFPVDARGLMAMPPGGDASRGAPKGAALFSGKAQFGLINAFHAQQETLYTLAADTGGKATLDSNDLSEGIVQAQKAVESYYILGYYSSNPAEDGRFRRTEVRLKNRHGFHLDHRAGYFAAKRFDRMGGTEKERQLEDALLLGDPIHDLPLALEVDSFRLSSRRYFAAVAVKIPGSSVPVARKGGAESATFDFIGQVRDMRGSLVAGVRDAITVRLGSDASGGHKRGHIQYDTGFTLAPGEYRLRFLVRENHSGRMGTFERVFRAPEAWPEREWLSMSSVVWSVQREALLAAAGRADGNQKRLAAHPLVRDGAKLIPSITRVFRQSHTLIAYAEVYDPSCSSDHPKPSVAAAVGLYRAGSLVKESEPVVMEEYVRQRSGVVPVEVQVPLNEIPPGRYVAQFNVFDQVARSFAQRRVNIVVLP